MIVGVQLARDDDKQRRWLAASTAMDNLAVIIHDASVARSAAEAAHLPNGDARSRRVG